MGVVQKKTIKTERTNHTFVSSLLSLLFLSLFFSLSLWSLASRRFCFFVSFFVFILVMYGRAFLLACAVLAFSCVFAVVVDGASPPVIPPQWDAEILITNNRGWPNINGHVYQNKLTNLTRYGAIMNQETQSCISIPQRVFRCFCFCFCFCFLFFHCNRADLVRFNQKGSVIYDTIRLKSYNFDSQDENCYVSPLSDTEALLINGDCAFLFLFLFFLFLFTLDELIFLRFSHIVYLSFAFVHILWHWLLAEQLHTSTWAAG